MCRVSTSLLFVDKGVFRNSLASLLLFMYFVSFRYNLFTGCPKGKTCTMVLRGGSSQFLEETERSLHDAIMIVRRALKHDSIVAGNGLCNDS